MTSEVPAEPVTHLLRENAELRAKMALSQAHMDASFDDMRALRTRAESAEARAAALAEGLREAREALTHIRDWADRIRRLPPADGFRYGLREAAGHVGVLADGGLALAPDASQARDAEERE